MPIEAAHFKIAHLTEEGWPFSDVIWTTPEVYGASRGPSTASFLSQTKENSSLRTTIGDLEHCSLLAAFPLDLDVDVYQRHGCGGYAGNIRGLR